MSLSALWTWIYGAWIAGEVVIAVATRTRRGQANIQDREKILVTGMPHACTAFWSSAVARIAMPILL